MNDYWVYQIHNNKKYISRVKYNTWISIMYKTGDMANKAYIYCTTMQRPYEIIYQWKMTKTCWHYWLLTEVSFHIYCYLFCCSMLAINKIDQKFPIFTFLLTMWYFSSTKLWTYIGYVLLLLQYYPYFYFQ